MGLKLLFDLLKNASLITEALQATSIAKVITPFFVGALHDQVQS
jgi:hypothetical protein